MHQVVEQLLGEGGVYVQAVLQVRVQFAGIGKGVFLAVAGQELANRVHRLVVVLLAERPDGIERLQSEAEIVDHRVAGLAVRPLGLQLDSFAGIQHRVGIGTERAERFVRWLQAGTQHTLGEEHTAVDGRTLVRIGVRRQQVRVGKQPLASAVVELRLGHRGLGRQVRLVVGRELAVQVELVGREELLEVRFLGRHQFVEAAQQRLAQVAQDRGIEAGIELEVLGDVLLVVQTQPVQQQAAHLRAGAGVGHHPVGLGLHLFHGGQLALPGSGTQVFVRQAVPQREAQSAGHIEAVAGFGHFTEEKPARLEREQHDALERGFLAAVAQLECTLDVQFPKLRRERTAERPLHELLREGLQHRQLLLRRQLRVDLREVVEVLHHVVGGIECPIGGGVGPFLRHRRTAFPTEALVVRREGHTHAVLLGHPVGRQVPLWNDFGSAVRGLPTEFHERRSRFGFLVLDALQGLAEFELHVVHPATREHQVRGVLLGVAGLHRGDDDGRVVLVEPQLHRLIRLHDQTVLARLGHQHATRPADAELRIGGLVALRQVGAEVELHLQVVAIKLLVAVAPTAEVLGLQPLAAVDPPAAVPAEAADEVGHGMAVLVHGQTGQVDPCGLVLLLGGGAVERLVHVRGDGRGFFLGQAFRGVFGHRLADDLGQLRDGHFPGQRLGILLRHTLTLVAVAFGALGLVQLRPVRCGQQHGGSEQQKQNGTHEQTPDASGGILAW